MSELRSLRALDTRAGWTGVEKPQLEVPRQALNCLGNPQNDVPAIHIAGTNGKGTVAAVLSSIFRSSGKHVGQIVSPHLHDVTERLLIDGHPVAAELLDRALNKLEQAEAKEGLRLSYFEAVVAASYQLCADLKLDWTVVEVGLGGRFDATNLIHAPKTTVIVSIGLDHMNILGNTEAEIAFEKAGIFRAGVPAVIGPMSPEALRTIKDSAAKLPCPLEVFGDAYWIEGESVCDANGWRFALPVREKKLLARYQRENFAVAAYIAHRLGCSDAVIRDGMMHMRWPGRVEEVTLVRAERTFRVLLDGAHNPDGVRGLGDYLDHVEEREIFFLISILATKDFSEMAKQFRAWQAQTSKKNHFYFCPMEHPGSAASEVMRAALGSGIACTSREDALRQIAAQASDDALIVVAGSLYFIGEIRGELVQQPFCTIV